MKILYAASNNYNARIQLARFISHMSGHQIKMPTKPVFDKQVEYFKHLLGLTAKIDA